MKVSRKVEYNYEVKEKGVNVVYLLKNLMTVVLVLVVMYHFIANI